MHRNTVRFILVGIAVFYAVVGGLWATNYFPLQNALRQTEIQKKLMRKTPPSEWATNAELTKSSDIWTDYVMSHPSFSETRATISLYQSILLWGTISLGVGASVVFLTRGKRVD